MVDRIALLLGNSTKGSRILEIGPSHSPIAPKAAGWKTHVVDHTDQEGLRAKYTAMDVDVSAVEPVDTVWQGGPLDQAVPAALLGQFDTLIASHVIEHIPDFISFLKSAERLLAPHGVISLAIPDPRYCFDYFKPRSTTGDVLEAYALRRTGHSVRALWNHAAYSVDMDGTGAWGQHPVARPTLVSPFAEAAALSVDLLRESGGEPYRDCHTWAFTPAGLTLIMLELAQLRLVDWHIDSLHGPNGCEFIVYLRRGIDRIVDPEQLESRRMVLLLQQLRESVEQLSFAEKLVPLSGLPTGVEDRLARIEQQLLGVRYQVFGDSAIDAAIGAPDQTRGQLGLTEQAADTVRRVTILNEVTANQNERLAGLEGIVARLVSLVRPLLPVWRLIRPR